jgi:hypothetical protein
MARESDFEQRRRQRELEDERDAEEARLKTGRKQGAIRGAPKSTGDASIDKLLELFSRVEPLIDQVNGLYGQYIAGVETRPPSERREHLDQLMVALQGMSKPTAAYQFRYQSMNSSYLSHRDRWDRMCKDLESGKIVRTAGPPLGRRKG